MPTTYAQQREDVIEHAFGHRDAELTIDRRNEPRTHGKATLRRRDALDESGELRLIRHAADSGSWG